MHSICPWQIKLKTEVPRFPLALISQLRKDSTPTVFSLIDFFTLAV